jgi:hypothetical protein
MTMDGAGLGCSAAGAGTGGVPGAGFRGGSAAPAGGPGAGRMYHTRARGAPARVPFGAA